MGSLFTLIYLSAVFAVVHSHRYSAFTLRSLSSQKPKQGYGIPERLLNPPPPPVARSSSPNNDADYVIEEYPGEVPVKSKPIESPDQDPVFVGQDGGDKPLTDPPVIPRQNSYNNVRPPVPVIPSAGTLDPPLGGYEDPRETIVNRDPAKQPDIRPVGSQYPLTPSNDETLLGTHHTGAAGCTCVPYFQCDEYGYMITNGAGIIDPRIHIPTNPNLANSRSYQNDDNVRPNFCGTYHTCCKEQPRQAQKVPEIAQPTCGTRNPSGMSPRILAPGAKSESDFGEWPWMAAVLKLENGVHVFQCGGTLIDNQHILTVAHCVSGFSIPNSDSSYDLVVRLGEWDTQQETELIPHQDYKVIRVVVHPQFMNQSLWNDIAILRLHRLVEMKQNVNPVCLPSLGDSFEGQICTTSGWGKNAYQGGSYSNIMKEAHLPVIPRKECMKSLRSTRLGPRFRLHSSFMCAGGEKGVDSCKGDGGGPLVCERKDGSYAVAGLVAWGIDCGQPGIPGVYVDVQQFLQFIKDYTANFQEPYNDGRGSTQIIAKQPHSQEQYQRPEEIERPIQNPMYQRPQVVQEHQRPQVLPDYQWPKAVPDYQKPPITSGYQDRPMELSTKRPSNPYGDAPQVRPPQSFPASGY